MNARPHFRTHVGASKAWDTALLSDPRSITTAVSRTTAFGVIVREEDLPLLITKRVEEMIAAGDVTGANVLKNQHITAYQDEQRALKLLHARRGGEAMPSIDASQSATLAVRELARLELRERFAVSRGNELYEAELATARAAAHDRARAEFDRQQPPLVQAAPVIEIPKAATPKGRKS